LAGSIVFITLILEVDEWLIIPLRASAAARFFIVPVSVMTLAPETVFEDTAALPLQRKTMVHEKLTQEAVYVSSP